jgi:hypothetical protein
VAHFKKTSPIEKSKYLVALSKVFITPGGLLPEGFYSYITDDVTLHLNATVIFIWLG